MPPVLVTRWSRRFVATGALFFVAWGVAALAAMGRRTEVTLLLFGFVLHTVFGKGYALVPTYFDRSLAVPQAPAVQYPLTVLGTVALAASAVAGVPEWTLPAGAVLWAAGVAVFLGAMGWTLRGNLTGAETGTGEHNEGRQWVDRAANAAVPVVLLYLLAGTYELLAGALGLPTLLDGTTPQVSHLIGAGTATLLVFAVGFRLFPRFLVAHPPRWLVAIVLLAGALGPGLIALALYSGGGVLHAGAGLQAVAMVGFALGYASLFAKSERRRLGLYTVLLAVAAGIFVVALGLQFAVATQDPALVAAHYRLALGGFLGLTIVGATYQFYPPSVGEWPMADETAASQAVAVLAIGFALQLFGPYVPLLAVFGLSLAALGAIVHAYVLFAALRARPV